MAEETESGATLLAKKEYARAVPILKREHEKYASNPRIRLQYADALAGAGQLEEAIVQYEATAKYYDDNGLTVQAIAVRKKAEKAQEQLAAKKPAPPAKPPAAANRSSIAPFRKARCSKSSPPTSARPWCARWSSSSSTKGP